MNAVYKTALELLWSVEIIFIEVELKFLCDMTETVPV